MALKQINPNKLPDPIDGILLNLNNGDLQAVEEAKTKWNFKKPEDVLRYALAVIAQSDSSTIYIVKNGERISLAPGKDLLEEEVKTNEK